jgi:hypothetical protein
MPRRDGTGPMGAGSMTGRGLGICTGRYDAGLGCRRGFGRSFAAAPIDSKTQKELLQEQKDLLKNRLEWIDNQLENL